MKKYIFLSFLILLCLLTACSNKSSVSNDDTAETPVASPETSTALTPPAEETAPLPELPEVVLQTMDNSAISSKLSEKSLEEFAKYDALPSHKQLASSFAPGMCMADYDSWGEFEEFVGTSIPNPLENCQWIAQNSTVHALWYGTRDGNVEYLVAQTEYKYGDLRVNLDLEFYFSTSPNETEKIHPLYEIQGNDYHVISDDITFYVFDYSVNYFSRAAYFTQGTALCRLSVTGNEGKQEDVIDTFDKLLASITL